MLYFLKESNKIKLESLLKMKQEALEYLQKLNPNQKTDMKFLLKSQEFLLKIPNFVQAHFILIVEGCLNNNQE